MKSKKTKQMHYWNSETLDKENRRIRAKQEMRQQRKSANLHSQRHPGTREITAAMLTQPGFHDLTNSFFGNDARVIGLSVKNQKWLCRCRCGEEFLRTTSSIINVTINGDKGDGAACCDVCYDKMIAWAREYLQNHGDYPTWKSRII